MNTDEKKTVRTNNSRSTRLFNNSTGNRTFVAIIRPLRILAILAIVSGLFAMLFEVQHFQEFSIQIYVARLLATLLSFIIFSITFTKLGKSNPIIFAHILLISIICSFVFLIVLIPDTLFLNSHILSLLIFTTALFLSWDIKNQLIVGIYYNILFAGSIFMADNSVYYLPNMFAAVIFVMLMSLLSIIAVSVNYKSKLKILGESFEITEIFNRVPEGIFRCSSEGVFITMNPALINILGFSNSDDLKGIYNLRYLFKFKNDLLTFNQNLKENGNIKNFNAKLIKSDGSIFTACINTWVSFSENVEFYEGTLSDVTEKEKVDLKIQEYNVNLKNLNASKDKFFSIVAHDLRTPFSALMGYTEIIVNEAEEMSMEEIKEFAVNMNNVAKNTYSLLQNLLDWSRIQTGRIHFDPCYFNLLELCEKVITLLSANASIKSIKLENEIPASLRTFADKNMIYTILRNLVSNSIKFTNHHGVIKIYAKKDGDFYDIIVQDSGIGIAKEKIEKLFNVESRFSDIGTANESGTGLGLILCDELVKKNGGEIKIESEVSKGSKFIIKIRLKDKQSVDDNQLSNKRPNKYHSHELAEPA